MAKSDKSKLPKKVGGVKVPKALRKSGALETLVGSEAGRRILADAILAAASAAAAALTGDRSGKDGERRKRSSESVLSDATGAAAGAVAGVISQSVQDFVGGQASEPRKPERRAKNGKQVIEPAPAATTDRARASDRAD